MLLYDLFMYMNYHDDIERIKTAMNQNEQARTEYAGRNQDDMKFFETEKSIKALLNQQETEAYKRFLNQNTNTTSEGDDNTMDELERKSYECAKDTVMKLQAMNQELQGRIRELETELHQAKQNNPGTIVITNETVMAMLDRVASVTFGK